jgi:hypothetical protein
MQRLLSSSIALLTLMSAYLPFSAFADQDSVVQIPSDADFAAMVFVGPDDEMPAAVKLYISINPTRDHDGHIVTPSDVREVMLELVHSLPRWYVNALARSSGDFTCTVMVAESERRSIDYSALIEDWFWINWHMQDSSSPLRRNLETQGLKSRDAILEALRSGFCNYAKAGNLSASVELVAKYGHKIRAQMNR